MVLNGLGGVIFGQIIVLTPPSFSTPSNNCTGNFTVAWGAVTFATGYILQRRVNGGAWTPIYSGPNLSFAQNNLAPGSYEYRVISVKGNKQSEPVASGAVTVAAQGNVGAPFRQGNQLIQQVQSGCSVTNNVIGTYGCTDPTAANYNASATIGEGCVWNNTACEMDSPPFWVETANVAQTQTFQLSCTATGSGILNFSYFIDTNDSNTVNTWISGTYVGQTATFTFSSNYPWHWVSIHISGFRRLA